MKYLIEEFIKLQNNYSYFKDYYESEEKINESKNITLKINEIKKELNIQSNDISNNTNWRKANILATNMINDDKNLLELNYEINKLTDSNFDLILNKINNSLVNSFNNNNNNDIKSIEKDIKIKTKYLIDNIIKKCIIQTNFISINIRLLESLNKNPKISPILIKYVSKNIDNLVEFMINIENIDNIIKSKEYENNTYYKLVQNNKQFNAIGGIYSLYYIHNFISNEEFYKLILKFIKLIEEYIEWDPITNDILEKFVNTLSGLLENGYYKMIEYIDNDSKIKLDLKINNLINTKKISMRIKFNLQNLYDNLKSGKNKKKSK